MEAGLSARSLKSGNGMSEKLTLTELQLIIRDSLYMALPEMYWVIAEISEIKENYSGHCYLELVEKQSDEKNIRSRVRAIIWCKRYNLLKSYFESTAGETLKEGLKILVRVKVEYHELYGLSLIICDIDPAFTVGELAIRRQQIIRQLEEEGIFSMNKEIGLPFSLQRIAIISSANAAGYIDFLNHLTHNNYGYVFHTRLFESPMQGSETEKGIISALDKISVHQEHFDAVVIIRGGGSQVDLSWFDNYNIAYYITQFPLPVFTGIGHDKDMSVSDLVATVALKTPTAVADFIVNHMAEIENRLRLIWTEIRDLSRSVIEKNRNRIESSAIKLSPLATIMLSAYNRMLAEKTVHLFHLAKDHIYRVNTIPAKQISRLSSGCRAYLPSVNTLLNNAGKELKTGTHRLIGDRKSSLAVMDKTLSILKPESVIKRGYTITSFNGKIITRKENLRSGDRIDTLFQDGTISSKITDEQEISNS